MEKKVGIWFNPGYGDSFYDQSTSPTGDCWIVKGQNPHYAYDIKHFWGKPHWVGKQEKGDGTARIIDHYRHYAKGNRTALNVELLDYHADMLAAALIDFVVFDFTNGYVEYPSGRGPSNETGTHAICIHWQNRMRAGKKTPQISFAMSYLQTLLDVKQHFFSQYDSNLFFRLEEHFLAIMSGTRDANEASPNSWNIDKDWNGVPTNGLYGEYDTRIMTADWDSGRCWNQRSARPRPPLPFYYNGRPEQVSVPVSFSTPTYTDNGETPTPGAQGRQDGRFFEKHMDAAIAYGARIALIYSWNEWNAGNQAVRSEPQTGKFVDQWNYEYSSDIEPVWGGPVNGFETAPLGTPALWHPEDPAWDPRCNDDTYQLMKKKIKEFKASPFRDPIPPLEGSFRISNRFSNMRLHASGGVEGSKIIQKDRTHPGATGVWTLEKLQHIPGTVRMRNNAHTELYLGIDGGKLDSYGTLGESIYASLGQYNGTPAQAWRLIPHLTIPNFYLLRAAHSGLLLSIPDGNASEGVVATQIEHDDTIAQAWTFEPA